MDEQFTFPPPLAQTIPVDQLPTTTQPTQTPSAPVEPTPIVEPVSTSQPAPQPVAQPAAPKYVAKQHKNSFPSFLTLLFTAIIFAAGGYLGAQYVPMTKVSPTPTPTAVVQTPTPTPKPTSAPKASPLVVSGWGSSVIPELKMKLQYPMKLDIFTNIADQTVFAAENEYWITTSGAGDASPILWMYLYKSDKLPLAWFETDGIGMYKAYAEQMSAGAETSVTYVSTPVSVDGSEAYDVVITSKGFEGPKSPIQYVRVFQHKGYVVMTEYDEHGDPETSKKILDTFDFTE